MKPQDILFLLVTAFLLYKRNPKFFVMGGLLLTLFSMPLFAKWIFFTAERFVWYAVGWFGIGIALFIIKELKG